MALAAIRCSQAHDAESGRLMSGRMCSRTAAARIEQKKGRALGRTTNSFNKFLETPSEPEKTMTEKK
jgi:hypothetical protein